MERDELKQISNELEHLLETTPLKMKENVNGDGVGEITEEDKILAGETLGEAELEREEPEEPGESQFLKKASGTNVLWFRPADGLPAAFLIPMVIMIIIFVQRGIFPFGEESFLRTDMYHQYAPFFAEFRDKLTNGGSLLYSWNIGMGVNFSALFAYYLASPLNWLLILCPKNLILEFMTYSIVLKIGLSGLSFAYYLKKHSKTDEFAVAFFGIFYALSGYMAAYSWNIMWLDCILLFPLVVLGLERLVKEKKCLLYCVSLGLCILSNYYISIMICLFLVIYFIAILILEKRKTVKEYCATVSRFSLFSLIAGGLAAVVLIPEVYALQATASGDFIFPKTYESYFSIFDMLARHIGNIEIEIGLDHWPNIYCGVAVFLFFLLYLAGKKISVKEKAVYCGLLLIFFASFSINILNFIWHGLHFPNSLPGRQSFIYIFLMLFICYRAYGCLKETPWKHIVIAFWGAVSFILLAQKLVTQEHFNFIVYYVALVFLALYAGLLYLYKKKSISINLLLLMALSLVSMEAAINTTVTSVTSTSRTSYVKDNTSIERLTDSLKPGSTFYRVEKVERKTKNDGAWMSFPSVSVFSSTANADVSDFFKKIGCESSTNAYSMTGSTPLVDSLFAVKYALYSSKQEETELLKFKAQDGDVFLYENLYTLPVGFLVPFDFEDNWRLDLEDPAEVQNDLAAITVGDIVLEPVDGYGDGQSFTFTPEIRGDYYAYISNKKVESVTFSVGDRSESLANVDRGYLLSLGTCEEGEEVVLKAGKEGQSLNARVYRFSPEIFRMIYEELNESPLHLTSWTDTSLGGMIDTDQAGVLFTSIPYDQGWSVTLDGKKVPTEKILDTFLAVKIPEGEHILEFHFVPDGLVIGMIITGICMAILAAYVWITYTPEKCMK